MLNFFQTYRCLSAQCVCHPIQEYKFKKKKHVKKILTFSKLLFPSWPAGALVLHALQWSERHVEVTVRTAPESA